MIVLSCSFFSNLTEVFQKQQFTTCRYTTNEYKVKRTSLSCDVHFNIVCSKNNTFTKQAKITRM